MGARKILRNSLCRILVLFDKAMKRSSSKRAGDELEQENAKKQKVDEDKETTKLQSLIEVVSDDEKEVAIDDVPLANKPPTIVDWKDHKRCSFIEEAKCVHSYIGREEISPYTIYNYKYAEQEASG
ncbi:hypothetical protein Tco_1192842 [Tanacetum coccineum]